MRAVVAALEESRIREVANAGLGRPDVLRFWFGESDEATPEPVREAAIASLQAGETFYAHNLGLPELREAIAVYMAQGHPAPSRQAADWFGRIAVTSGGVNGLMLAVQAVVEAGDEVVVVEPVWPNLIAQPRILGATVRTVALAPDARGLWRLDLEALLNAITPTTRLLIVNSPNNPTGWTLSAAEQQAILAHCRSTGTWIVADEVYERLYYPDSPQPAQPARAPSFLDIAAPEDRLIVAHSFSKSFLMTGWRLGWLVLPPSLTHAVGKLVEYNTSCAPVFVQRGAWTALQHAPDLVPPLIARFRTGRDTLLSALADVPGVQVAPPPGGMYAFFRLAGQGRDDLTLAKRLVLEAGLGLAPGSAFGATGAGWLRWCFASRDPARLVQGVGRLVSWLSL